VRGDDRFGDCLLNQWVRLCSNPPQYCSFSVTVSAVSSNSPLSAKTAKKTNPRHKIRGIWKMPPMRLASLLVFQRVRGAGFSYKKTPAFQRHFKTMLCTVLWAFLWAVLSASMSTVRSAFSLNDFAIISRPDLLLLSSHSNAGGIWRRRYRHSGRH
jgi:hypothetical protein